MDTLEIVLLVAGIVIMILSFLLPGTKKAASEEVKRLTREEIRGILEKEMERAKSHIDESVEESIEYAVEKTERSMERLTNEKIMAINEYSDTVLKEIHKNHEEALFLYDMLNSKHTNLKNTVSEINRTVKEAAETTREAEAAVSSFQRLAPESVMAMPEEAALTALIGEDSAEENQADAGEEVVVVPADNYSRNERIRTLHKLGKTPKQIARELGIGVGEVQLIVDLYKNT